MSACSCSISLLRRQVRSRYCRFPSIQAIVWSAKLGTCNRSCNRLGTVLVLAEAGREYVKTAVLVCKAQSLLWATPLRGHMYRKAERSLGQQMQGSRPHAASVRPASVPVLASPGWGGSSPSCRHVSAASAVFSNSAPSTHPAIPLSIWTHHTGLTHLPLRPSRRPAPTLATYSAASLNSGSLRRSHFVVKKTPRAFQSQRAVAS